MHKVTADILFQFTCAKNFGATSKIIYIPEELNDVILEELKQVNVFAVPYDDMEVKDHKVYQIYC
jgi:hypothetical protein